MLPASGKLCQPQLAFLVQLLARETFLAGFKVHFATRPITDEPTDIRNQSIEINQSVGYFFIWQIV
jgi:hypothetical protein